MDEINKLQEEIQDIRRVLQKKEELLSRLKNECGNKLNDVVTTHNEPTNILQQQLNNESSIRTVMSWTPNTQTNDLENTVFTNTQASEQSFTDTPKGCAVHNGSWTEQSQEPTNNEETNGEGKETGSKTQIGKTLPRWAIERYSRQILLPDIGVIGQEKLCTARVLIVGAGGLGCPAGVYLAGAGIGEIGIVDYDTVDLTNIHRQFLHGEKDQFVSKAESAANSLRNINSRIKVTPYNVQLNSENAIQIASQYDIVLDCTDNVPSRYLLNDLCVLTKLPLVSGSALKMEGQLTVYGYRASNNPNEKERAYIGPCYRCVFPSPPPAAAVGSCSAHGVAGPVPGAIGALQALEAMKYIIGQDHSRLLVQRMLLFDADDVTFRTVSLRPRNPNCVVCSDSPTVDRLVDYELFCKAQAKEKDVDLTILPPERRITPSELAKQISTDCKQRHLLVDVRNEAEFRMCRIGGSVNYPIDKLFGDSLEQLLKEIRRGNPVTFVCRRGNDSQEAAQKVLDLIEEQHHANVNDLCGGLHAWATQVDKNFPIY